MTKLFNSQKGTIPTFYVFIGLLLLTVGNSYGQTYCAATASSGCTTNSWSITNVKLGTINNTTACGNTTNGYNDFTAISTDLTQECTYSYSFTRNSTNFRLDVYIDFNNNGVFSDAGERIVNNTATSATVTGSFTVPANAPISSTRMRVFLCQSNPPANGCGVGQGAGEVEDYTINIIQSFTVSAGSAQSIGCSNSTTLSGNDPGSFTGLWSVVSGSGTFTSPTQFNTTVTGLGAGANVLRWSINNGNCTKSSDVTITRSNVFSNAGPDQSLCTSTATLAGNNPTTTVSATATGVWTIVSGSGTFANNTQFNTAVSNLGTGNNVFRWTVSDAGCEVPDDVTINSVTAFTWTGAANNTNWSTTSNWDFGVPIACANVIIPVVGNGSYPAIMPATVGINRLTVKSGASFTVPGTTTLTLADSLTVNGTLDNLGKINMTANKVFSMGAAGTYIHQPTITANNVSSANMFVNGVENFHPTSTLIIKSWYNLTAGLATNMDGDYGNVIIIPNNSTVPYTTSAQRWYQNNLLKDKIKGNLTLSRVNMVIGSSPPIGTGFTEDVFLTVGKSIISDSVENIIYGIYHSNFGPNSSSTAKMTITADSLYMFGGQFYMAYNLNSTANIEGQITLNLTKPAQIAGGIFVANLATNGANSPAPVVINGSINLSNDAVFSGVENTTAPFTFNGSNIALSNTSLFSGSYSTLFPANGNVTFNNTDISIIGGTFNGVYFGLGNATFNINSLSLSANATASTFNGIIGSASNAATGNILFNCGSINLAGASSSANISSNFNTGTLTSTVSGNVLIQNGTLNLKKDQSAGTITIGGNLTQSGGTINLFNPGEVASANNSTISMTVNGNFVQSGGAFEFDQITTNASATRNLNVKGNFTRTGGTFRNVQETTSRLNFNGTAAQTITGLTATRVYNLTFNNGAGLSFVTAPFSVINQLTLTNGRTKLNTSNLTLESTAPAIAGIFSATNMLVTNATGLLTKQLTATGSHIFPIGDSIATSEYSPITLNVTVGTFGTGASISARVDNLKHPNNGSNVNFLKRYWHTESAAITGLACTVTATYLAADVAGTEATIAHGTWKGAIPWVKGAIVNSTPKTLVYSDVDTLRQYTGINLDPPTVLITGNTERCSADDSTVLTAVATGDTLFTYVWSPATGLSSTTVKSPKASPAATTTYTVVATDANGFKATSPIFTLTVNPSPAAPIVTSPVTYCKGVTANPLTATGTSLKWYTTASGGTGSATAPTPSTATAGTTSYYVTETATGCESARAEIQVVINPQDDASFTYANAQYCQSGTNPSPTGVVTSGGTFSAGTGLSIDGTSGIINLAASTIGFYTVTYTTPAGNPCPNSATFNIEIIAAPSASFTYNTPFCKSDVNPSAIMTGGSTPGTFSSTAGLVFSNTSTGTINLSGSTADTYTITNTIPSNGACPVITATFSIEIKANPVAPTVTTPVTYCKNASSTPLSATGTGLLWYTASTGGTGSSTAPTPSTATVGSTNYYVSQTVNGCESPRAVINVTVNDLDDASFSYVKTTFCKNEANPSPSSVAKPGGTFSSASGLSVNASTGQIDLSTATAGAHTVEYTTNGICPQTSTFTIQIEAPQSAVFTYPSPVCINGTNPVSSVSGTYTSASLTFVSQTTGEVDLTSATIGTHRIYNNIPATAICGAVIDSFDLVIENAPGAPTVTSPVTYCQNATATPLTANGSGLLWYTSATGGTSSTTAPTPSTASNGTTNYYVSQTITGCESPRATITVNVNPNEDATFSYSASSYCKTGPINPTPTATGTTGGSFSGSNGLTINTSTGAIDLANTPIGSYIVTYTTGGFCAVSSTVNVDVVSGGSAQFTYPTPTCIGGANPLPTIAGGASAGTFSSNTLNFVSSATGEIDLSSATIGAHKIYNTISPAGCGIIVDSFNVTIDNGPNAPTVTSLVEYCQGATSTPLTAGGSNLLWYTSTTGGTGTANAPSPSTAVIGSTNFYVSQSVSGCESTRATITVQINAIDNASFSYGNSSYCQTASDPSPTISGLVGGTFTSSNGLFLNASTGEIDLSASTTGTYTIAYTTNGACPNNSTFSVQIISGVTAGFTYPSPVCTGGTNPIATLAPGASQGTYSSTGVAILDPATGEIDLSNSNIGTSRVYHNVTVTGCGSAIDSFDIVIDNGPNAPTVISTVQYCQGATATSLTAGGTNLLWYTTTTGGTGSTTAPTPSTASVGSTSYYVSQSNNGCESLRAMITVQVSAQESANFTYAANNYCAGGSNPSPTITGTTGGVFTANNNLVINASTGTIDLSGSANATYIITYTTNGNCSASANFTLTISTTGAAQFTYPSPVCKNGANPIPSIGAGSSSGTFTSATAIFISSFTGEINLSTTAAGVHRIYNTISPAGCAPVKDSFDITINNGPNAPVVSNVQYCQGETSTPLTASGTNLIWYINATGGTSSATAPSPSTATVGSLSYYVSQNANGCESPRATITVTVNAVDNAAISYGSNGFCVSASDPTPTVSASGIFSGNNGLIINSSTGTIDLDASGPGTYVVTYITNGSCPSQSQTTIQIDDFIDGSFSYSGIHCTGPGGTNPLPTFQSGAVAGTFSSTPAGLIFVNVNTGEIDIANSTPGTYTITNSTQQNGGCPVANHTSNIQLRAKPSLTVTDKVIECGQGIVITSNTSQSGGTYLWTPTGQTTSTLYVSPIVTTDYILSYSVGNGCTAKDTATVTVNQIPVSLANYNNVCVNWAPFAMYGGTPTGGNYSGPGVSSNIFYPVQANIGTNTITYTVTSGQCSNSATATIVVDGCVGLDEVPEMWSAQLIPNPSNGLFKMQFNNNFDGTIEIMDVKGKQVGYRSVKNMTEVSFDFLDLPNGVYFARIINEAKSQTLKVIIQR